MDLFRELVWPVLMKAALKRLFAAVPLLGWGPIGYIISHLAFKLSEKMFESADEFFDIRAIVFKNKELEKTFAKEELRLKLIARDKGINSDEFKQQRARSHEALDKFASFDTSHRP